MKYYLSTRYPLENSKKIFETRDEAVDTLLENMEESSKRLEEKIASLKRLLGDKFYFWGAKETLKINPSEHNQEEQAEIRLYKKIIELKNDLYMIGRTEHQDVFCTLLKIDTEKCPMYRKIYAVGC